MHHRLRERTRRAPDRADLRRHDPRDRRLHACCWSRRPTRSARVNEDFAVESLAGDIFQLGNTCYRILRVEPGRVRVEDAHGAPPNIPFWLGEAPGRSDELSFARRRACAPRSARRSPRGGARRRRCAGWSRDIGLDAEARAPARRLPRARARRARRAADAASASCIERFFDESGGMQLVIHAPFGSRAQPRLGPGAAQALLPQLQLRAAGRGDRGRDRAVAVDQPQLPARRGGALPALGHRAATCWCRRCSTRRCSACAGAGTRPPRWRCRASAAARKVRAAAAAHDVARTCSPPSSPTRSPAPRTSPASARCPTIRWSRRRCDDCLHEAMDADGWLALLRAHRVGRGRGRRARPAGALAARRRGAERAALRLPRRRAARGAPHAGRAEPPLDRPGQRRRPRPRSTPTRSPACARRPGRARATPTRCTRR